MCGIVGFISGDQISNKEEAINIVSLMSEKVKNRGPDDEGYWIDEKVGIVLAHRRLSVQDLSQAGHQPMISQSGRYVIIFNGEIYNHFELRTQVEATDEESKVNKHNKFIWKGHSDTETILMCFERWGIDETLIKLHGMFAFAVWDRKLNELNLCRDKIGEKPLYYGWQNETFLFASELKAIKCHPKFDARIDRGALTLLMRHNYIPCPYSIYTDIYKLEPGCIAKLQLNNKVISKKYYWSLESIAIDKSVNRFNGSAEDSVIELENLLTGAISSQMISDVPVGAFLSGGIDSSLVASIMQGLSSKPIRTFTIGYNNPSFNEAEYAKIIAQHLGTEHNELYVDNDDIKNVIPLLPTLFCEPFGDSSQVPAYLVSRLAKNNVSVTLSGDAGDELFCGYGRYSFTEKLSNYVLPIPLKIRKALAKTLLNTNIKNWDYIGELIGYNNNNRYLGDRIHKGACLLNSANLIELYRGVVSCTNTPSELIINGYEPSTQFNDSKSQFINLNSVEKMMLLDILTYLPDDNLVKLDRAAMGVSLEGRVPFLNHKIIEFALSLPLEYKRNNGIAKWPLRQILKKYIPNELFERPKMGFSMPLNDWLRGSLREWAEGLLLGSNLRTQGYFNSNLVANLWSQHINGQRNWGGVLWNILMFQAWLDHNHS